MAVSKEKKEGTPSKEIKAGGTGDKLATEMPLSEKDEVKRAEHLTNKGASKTK